MAGINRKSIVAEERLLESTVAAKRSTVELTKSILHLTSKIIAQVPKEKIDYETLDNINSKEIKQQMDNVMKNMDERDFQKKFNTLFEKNIIKKESIDNSWFKNESPQFDMNNTTKDAIPKVEPIFEMVNGEAKLISY